MQNTTSNDTNLDTKLSAIDKALAAAKARKAAKEAADGAIAPATAAPAAKEPKQPKAKKETQPDFAKAQRKEAEKALRIAAKEKRDAERAQRKSEKEAAKAGKAAHMKKVERAAEKLPAFASEQLTTLFNEVTTNYSSAQIAAFALHLQHFNRVKATERALTQRIETGSQVRITGGDPKYIGKTGVVSKAQRIRCYVEVPGVRKPVYLFTSDVELRAVPVVKATGTEG